MPGTVSYTNNEAMYVVYATTLLGLCVPGDITLSLKREWVDNMSHQTGTNLLDGYYKGEKATIKASLAEVDNMSIWGLVYHTGEVQVDGATPPNKRIVSNPSAAGSPVIGGTANRASTYAASLVLRPAALYVDTSTQTDRDIRFPKAFVREVGDIQYSIDTQEALEVTWEGLFTLTATDGKLLWHRGQNTGTGTWSAI